MISDMFQLGFGIFGFFVGILGLVGLYKSFQKADKPGVVALIPLLNLLNLIDMAGKPLWWILLFLVPGVNLVVPFLIMIGIAKRFGRGWLFGVGLVALAPVFWAILGFGEARYLPAAAKA